MVKVLAAEVSNMTLQHFTLDETDSDEENVADVRAKLAAKGLELLAYSIEDLDCSRAELQEYLRVHGSAFAAKIPGAGGISQRPSVPKYVRNRAKRERRARRGK